MFAYLQGTLSYKSPSLVYLDIAGVAYEVHITLRTFDFLQHLEQCRLYTYIKVAEDAWTIYGFADELEKNTFKQLIAINGVGTNTARILLSSISPSELEHAVISNDSKLLERVKGIGAKTAQRIILELKGKLELKGINLVQNHNISSVKNNTNLNDALIALMNLGLSKSVAETALQKSGAQDELSVEEIVKQALRNL